MTPTPYSATREMPGRAASNFPLQRTGRLAMLAPGR